MCSGVVPQQPPTMFDQAGGGEVAEQPCGLRRRLVVAAERVGQPGVRVACGVGAGQPGQVGDVRAHLLGAQRAVDADHQRAGVLDRGPERLDRLPGQRPAAAVDDRHRDPQRQVGGDLAGGGDRGLGVQRVEDRLDQQQVNPAVGQRLDLLRVGGPYLVEGDGPVGGVLHLRRQGQGDVQRPDRAGHEAAACLVRGLAGQLRAPQVHLPHQWLAGRNRTGRCWWR